MVVGPQQQELVCQAAHRRMVERPGLQAQSEVLGTLEVRVRQQPDWQSVQALRQEVVGRGLGEGGAGQPVCEQGCQALGQATQATAVHARHGRLSGQIPGTQAAAGGGPAGDGGPALPGCRVEGRNRWNRAQGLQRQQAEERHRQAGLQEGGFALAQSQAQAGPAGSGGDGEQPRHPLLGGCYLGRGERSWPT